MVHRRVSKRWPSATALARPNSSATTTLTVCLYSSVYTSSCRFCQYLHRTSKPEQNRVPVLFVLRAGVHQADRPVPMQHELGGPRGDGQGRHLRELRRRSGGRQAQRREWKSLLRGTIVNRTYGAHENLYI